jgi:hypothetical protein
MIRGTEETTAMTDAEIPQVTARTAFLMAARDKEDLSEADRDLWELSSPFDSRLQIPWRRREETPSSGSITASSQPRLLLQEFSR